MKRRVFSRSRLEVGFHGLETLWCQKNYTVRSVKVPSSSLQPLRQIASIARARFLQSKSHKLQNQNPRKHHNLRCRVTHRVENENPNARTSHIKGSNTVSHFTSQFLEYIAAPYQLFTIPLVIRSRCFEKFPAMSESGTVTFVTAFG